MKTMLRIVAITALFAMAVYAADDVASAIHGTVTKVDAATSQLPDNQLLARINIEKSAYHS